MADRNAFRKLKHSIAFVAFGEPLITLAISLVIVQQKIAKINQSARTQHVLHSREENPLIITIRNAG